MKKILAIMFIASLAFMSCNKDKDDTEVESKTELLTGSRWFHMRSTSQVSGITSEAPYSSFPICTKNNPYIFLEDSTFSVTEGDTKCTFTDPDLVFNGTWEFRDNENTLRFIIMGGSADWKIIKLTSDSLVISLTQPLGVSTNYYAHKYQ